MSPHPLRLVVTVLLAAPLAGCPGESHEDDASVPDAEVTFDGGLYVDTDGDGVCDLTEISRRTDPLVPDTDGDGFTDLVELYVLMSDATIPASPERDIVHTLRELPDSSVQIVYEFSVRGAGEDFTGAFEGQPARDLGGVTSADFYESSVAVYSNPADIAAAIEPEAERFLGVVGTTALGFELRMGFGTNAVRSCVRAYPFRYNVKRSDGRIAAITREILLVLPVGDTLATGEWCALTPPATGQPCM